MVAPGQMLPQHSHEERTGVCQVKITGKALWTQKCKTQAEEKQALGCPGLMTPGMRTARWPCKVMETWALAPASPDRCQTRDDLGVNHGVTCDRKARDRVITCTEGMTVSWQIRKGYLGLESQTRQDLSSQRFKRSLELSFFLCALTLMSLLLKCSFHPSLPANPFLTGTTTQKKYVSLP